MYRLFITDSVRLASTVTLFLLALTACSKEYEPIVLVPVEASGATPDDNEGTTVMEDKMKITLGSVSFTATLEDNATTRALVDMLPMALQMSELNGNEKYHYLSSSLPTNASNPGIIHAGDIMLYGSSCLVVFYKTFSTDYSYTRIGRIDSPGQLADAVGNGSVGVRLEMGQLTGVTATQATQHERGDGQRYNLSGTRVGKDYKGVYIKSGRKCR